MAVTSFIGLGSNLGDSAGMLRDAIMELDRMPDCSMLQASSLYRTAPIAQTPQPDYINAVARLDTALEPAELLSQLLALEARHGRVRSVADAPRTLDLDLLLYGDLVVDRPGLRLPHPRMHQRAFVLVPLIEIAPECAIPGHGLARDCLARLSGQRVEVMK
jgi:2-amino-4-hydroxy-6-hydroxymethyldihydropteridine diphosphokinase